ncbi:hypothetical protein [Fibrella forsythiae]|uniref:Phasin domain-containing protein n=1 Tax=Fibrella forsythiae TaxID=2817061 RepID=A0ABS3JQ67_9BACT|nr:hypothetical protein [Fibrella forsythiae]MBO0951077.1 hypothetical protein [Fibrella forsythiae]
MKNHHKQQATRFAEALIETNLSAFGREQSVKTAAHLQFADGFMRDYINELEANINSLDVAESLPPLIQNWDTLSSSAKRQAITEVTKQLKNTLAHANAFQRMLTGQTNFIEEVNAQAVEAETTRIARENKEFG